MRGLAFALALLVPAAAHAQTVSVERVRGPRGRWVERELARGLAEAGIEVREGAETTVSGRVARRGRRHALRLVVRTPDGEEVVSVTERSPRELLDAAVAAVVGHLRGAPAAAPARAVREPEQDAPRARTRRDPSTPTEARSAPATGRGEDALELAVGLGWTARALWFTDDLFDSIGAYHLQGAPMASAWGRWFPGHHWTSHPLAGIGVEAAAWGAFGLSSETRDARRSFETTVDDWRLGGVYRVRVVEPLRVEGALGYGEARFRVDPTGPARNAPQDDPIPSVRYRFVRPAIGAHLDLPEGFSLRADVGWRAVLDAGPMSGADWFPRSFTTGVDMRLEVRWRLHSTFAVLVYGEHARYVTDARPEPGDPRIAGGATDEWTRAGAEAVIVLGGAP